MEEENKKAEENVELEKKDDKKTSKKISKTTIIISILLAIGVFILVMGVFASALLVALNPVQKLNQAKIANCQTTCKADQECLNKCFVENRITVSISPAAEK